MKKKIIITLSALLIVSLGIVSTFAFLESEDLDTNVMTFGKVKIQQHEYEREIDENGETIADGKFQEYTQKKDLYPAVYSNNGKLSYNEEEMTFESIGAPGSVKVFDESVKNVIDKFVFVENSGRSAAYVRTIIAIEEPEGADTSLVHFSYNNDEKVNTWREVGYTEIDGIQYYLIEVTYLEALEAGKTSEPSLLQVFLDPKTTNEELELFGDTLEILAVSQAIQTKGFSSAEEALNAGFGEITVTQNPWVDGETTVDMWDGTADTSWYDGVATSYTLTTAEELAGLAELVNSGNNFSKKTIILASDIDLVHREWTPIGNSTNRFQGTFDGNGYTVSNLYIDKENTRDVGFFGFTTSGEIRNVKVHNASVTGYLDVGVVAGSPYTSKYNNIKVTGDVKVNGYAYVGGVFGKNVYADLANITVEANKGSYVKANSEHYRTYVGGVIGFMGEGGHTVSNVESNIDVYGSTVDVGGLTGIAHYGNTFKNCTVTGNVYITNATEAADAEEMGGIAGVWHNQTGYKVTFENCKFTGKLSANITEGVDLSDNTIAGAAYNSTGTGELIIK